LTFPLPISCLSLLLVTQTAHKLKGSAGKIFIENDLVRDDIAEKKKLVEYKRRLSEKGITSRVRGLRLLVNDHRYTLHDISENPAILEELGATQSKPPTRELKTQSDQPFVHATGGTAIRMKTRNQSKS
ncbi:hypothetical protein QE152_g36672, partial [Popillia japonica]